MTSIKSIVSLLLVMAIVSTPVLATSTSKSSCPATSGVLPLLPEATDEELLEAEGEFWWFLIAGVIGGGARAIYENWFDEDYGIDKDDGMEIAGTALAWGVGGSAAGMISAVVAFIR